MVAYAMRPVATKVRTSPRILLPSRACRSEARAVVGKKQRQKYPRLLIISLSLAASTFARGGAHSKSGASGCQCLLCTRIPIPNFHRNMLNGSRATRVKEDVAFRRIYNGRLVRERSASRWKGGL